MLEKLKFAEPLLLDENYQIRFLCNRPRRCP